MKIVASSALFGQYEPLQEIALAAGEAADFLLFTDSSGLRSATWKVVYVGRLSADSARGARRVKNLADEYLTLNPDAAAPRMDPRCHWSSYGYKERRRYRFQRHYGLFPT